jgi:hypothetical protein
MKFTVTLKDTDGLHCSLEHEELGPVPGGLARDELETLLEMRREKARAFATKWLEYGEYVVLEFDTEANTCAVVKP